MPFILGYRTGPSFTFVCERILYSQMFCLERKKENECASFLNKKKYIIRNCVILKLRKISHWVSFELDRESVLSALSINIARTYGYEIF